MSSVHELVKFAYECEYDYAYDLTKPKQYSNPKIYTANGDLSKRWYVYFSYRHPDTGKLKRQTPFYGITNSFKTKEERMSVLTVYRHALMKLLKQGFSPYEDNTELYQKLYPNSNEPKVNYSKSDEEKENHQKEDDSQLSIVEAFDIGLNLKQQTISQRTFQDYSYKINSFVKWLNANYPDASEVNDINKKMVLNFLNYKLKKSSSRNRNNYHADLSSVMQTMVDNGLVVRNFFKDIKKLKSKPERHKTFNQKIESEIFSYLKAKDPILLLFIKFYSYTFMRPIEACRLRIKDVDIESRTISFKAKNKNLKTKLIPQIILDELPDISKLHPDSLFFTPTSIGGNWDANENNRRDYFTKQFNKVVKSKFNLGKDYGLYSFRHTFITKLYKAMAKESTPFETKSKLMQITGHSTMEALEKYLRDIDAELPPDFSNFLKNY